MPKIINLSSCHTLHPIYSHYGIGAFAELRRKYNPDCCYFPLDFTKPIRNWGAIVYDYKRHESIVIEPYKRGEKATGQFFEDMLTIFNFLKKPENSSNSDEPLLGEKPFPFLEEDIQLVEENRAFLLTVQNKNGPLSHNDYAKALLEMAWTARIDYTQEDMMRCESIFSKASEEDPIYIISNTNATDVNKMVLLLMSNKQINWNQHVDLLADIDKGIEQNLSGKSLQDKLIQLAPGIYLCLSYKIGLYKTIQQNQELMADNSTSSLISALVDYIGSPENIEIISRWEPDLREAVRLGILEKNCHTHNNYFRLQQSSCMFRIC